MKTTREEREQWATRINQRGPLRSPVGLNWSSVARLVADVDQLEEALLVMLDEYDPTWEEWTETDDRLLTETGTGRARAALNARFRD